MDYSKLRAAALRDGEDEEAVTVDTRALIDKVLARYSGEWTTLRELIQNAADAQATTVKIKWETLPSTTVPVPAGATAGSGELLGHTIMHHTLRRLLVENDGQSFTSTDWARLKRIAEGNPDETKIGAFGVGFYSVFADCEEPFVSSGREAMAFYWKGNALFTRKLVVPEDQRSDKDSTTFVLDYRNSTTALPNLLSVSQFLATSLTFVALQHVEFWIDDWKVLDLHKQLSPSSAVGLPRDLDTRTKDGLMTVAAVERSSARIDAVYMNAVGWKPRSSAGGASSSHGANSGSSKSTDTYGLAASDLPSLRSFFSRLTGSSSASTAQANQRNKAAREEKEAQDAIEKNLTGQSRASIFLRVTSAQVQTKVAASFATELERATKKPPPKKTKMAILTTSYEDVLASESSAKVPAPTAGEAPPPYSESTAVTKAAGAPTATAPAADIFASVLPSKKPGGRIFIGFPTMQTTGGGMHVSAPSLIPTVEREAIDLNARWVRNWNMELLRVAGILTRLAFTNEMADLGIKFRQYLESTRPGATRNSKVLPTPTEADLAKFVPEALHILKTYTFGDSTPSGYVGQIIEEAFWTCYKTASLDVFSSRGVLSTTRVRMGNDEISKFINGIPVVVPQMRDDPFMRKLYEFGIVRDATIDDVQSELESRPLSKEQLIHFVRWAAGAATTGELDPPSVKALMRVAVASIVEDNGQGDGQEQASIIELRSITNFLSGNKIPASLPLPPSTIPYAITSTVPQSQLQALGWAVLELEPWLKYLISARGQLGVERDITHSAPFAAQVLTVLSKNWDNLHTNSRLAVQQQLKAHTTIPTRMGMKLPHEAFFPSVKLFDDLPIILPSCHNLKEKFLVALGVRKTIDLDTIFTRLLSQPSESESTRGDTKGGSSVQSNNKKWSHVELVKYLASVRADIPTTDMVKLQESQFCPAEAGPAGMESTVPSAKLYKPKQLFEPNDKLRALGIPIMQWPGPPGSYRRNSTEAQFLTTLGLRCFPTVTELLDKMASPDRSLRDKARAYYIENHQLNGYVPHRINNIDRAILPVMARPGSTRDKDQERLVTPSQCYTNAASSVLGFDILRSDLHPHAGKFGVARDPPIADCVSRLLGNPPRTREDAVILFEYFSSRLYDVTGQHLLKLQKGAFVPIMRTKTTTTGNSQDEGLGGWGNEKKKSLTATTTTTVEHVQPQSCYLGSSSTYGEIFDFVDFGANANAFLFKCGSRSEPTKVEIARLACTEPARLLSTLQTTERYLNLLRSLADDLQVLKADHELFRMMKRAPFLLASREVSQQPSSENSNTGRSLFGGLGFGTANSADKAGLASDSLVPVDNEDEAPVRQFQLAPASKIAVLDDYISYRLFKDTLMCAPEEDSLETFYLALGSQMLSSIVQEDIRIGEHSQNQQQAEELRKYVLERSKIFLYEYQRYRHDAIKHDHKWLEKNLRVEMVQSVSLQRSLRGSSQTHTEKRSAASTRSRSGYVLYVSKQARLDMYQIGQAVCQLVLKRPSQQAYFFFEPFLKLELLDLRARGYNVDRILRAKQAEARIAEEERRKALEAEQEQARLADQELATQRSQQASLQAAAAAARGPAQSPEPRMPGAFGSDDPSSPSPPRDNKLEKERLHMMGQDHPAQQQQQLEPPPSVLPQHTGRRGGRSLLSNFTRKLGLDQYRSDDNSDDDRHLALDDGSGIGSGQGPTPGEDDGRVTSPETVRNNMVNAIRATRPYGSSTLFEPPKTSTVKEQSTYCDSHHAHDLTRIGQAPGGMYVYVSREVSPLSSWASPAGFLRENARAIQLFEFLLADVASVYSLPRGVLHMYHDQTGPTIAFNTNGSIFCNLRYFVQLHQATMERAEEAGSQSEAAAASRVEATVWWWVVIAHELAHNLEASHNANHSYYTESFVQQYYPTLATRTAQWMSRGPPRLQGTAGDNGAATGGGRSQQPVQWQGIDADEPEMDRQGTMLPSYQQATQGQGRRRF